jgi:hypothetical protein
MLTNQHTPNQRFRSRYQADATYCVYSAEYIEAILEFQSVVNKLSYPNPLCLVIFRTALVKKI